MLLVIFGAGATYDSWSSFLPGASAAFNAMRPPLAKDLFDSRPSFRDIMKQYQKCFDILPRLERPPEDSTVEHELEKIQASTHYDIPQQLTSIRFYLRDMIWDCVRKWMAESRGASNYKALLNSISAAGLETIFVTFNYDLMLEDALQHHANGQVIRRIKDYVAGGPFYRTIKLHGSVNWVHTVLSGFEIGWTKMDDAQVAQELIRHANSLVVANDVFRILDPPISKDDDGAFLVPALAIPTETKQSYECPKEHLEVLTDQLPKVTDILMIGWAANEINFLKLLKERLNGAPRMVIVSGGSQDGNEVKEKITKAGINFTTSSITAGGFSNFVRGEAGRFLRHEV